MMYVLISVISWLALATLPQLIPVWINKIKYARDKKNHPEDEDWIYKN